MKISRKDFEKTVVADDGPDPSYLEGEEHAERRAAYARGDFHFVGVRASVEIQIPHGPHTYITHRVTSPGLWGIESDSDESYLEEVFQDECATLEDMLRELSKIEVEATPAPAKLDS